MTYLALSFQLSATMLQLLALSFTLCAMRAAVVLALHSAIPGPCSAEQTSLGRIPAIPAYLPRSRPRAGRARQNSAIGKTNFFMNSTPIKSKMLTKSPLTPLCPPGQRPLSPSQRLF